VDRELAAGALGQAGPGRRLGGIIRIWGRFAIVDDKIGQGTNQKGVVDADHPFLAREDVFCCDVNNGLVLWRKPRVPNTSEKRFMTAVGHGRCYTWWDHRQPLVAVDLATGEVRESFPGSEMKPYQVVSGTSGKITTRDGIRGDSYWVRVGEKHVLANGDGSLRAWTLDGKPLWTWSRAGAAAEIPALDEARGLAYVMLVDGNRMAPPEKEPMRWSRWPASEQVVGFAAIDLATGKTRWENTELASRKTDILHGKTGQPLTIGWGQLIVAGPHLVVMSTNSIGGGRDAVMVAAMDPATGKTVHFDPMLFVLGSKEKASFDGGLRNVAYRDGKIYVLSSNACYLYDPLAGTQERVTRMIWNARCVRPILTPEHILIAHTAFIEKDFSGLMYASARSGCAMSPVPGAGLILFGPHMCGCVTHLDGHFATTSRPVGPPLPDAQRRVTEKPSSVAVPPATPPGQAIAGSLLAEQWRWFTISGPVIATTVEQDGWSFRVDPSAQRIDAAGPGGKKWAYLAEARIGTGIVVTADRVVLGSHDGWVHGLDRATGALVWKYLLAPSHRLIVANNLLTSTWPVFGVADLGKGVVVASAGIHVEHEGGIRVAGLRASDGGVVWLKALRKPPSTIAAGDGPKRIIERSVINVAPRVVDGKVVIKGIEYHMGGVEFSPDEDEQAINTRLDTPPKR
jgi:outer membrane protein assembly factor BamB